MGGRTLSMDNEVEGAPTVVNNGVPLQLYCPSQASAAYGLDRKIFIVASE